VHHTHLVLGWTGLHGVGRGVLWRRRREGERVLSGGRRLVALAHLAQLVLHLRLLGAGELAHAPGAGGGEGLVLAGQPGTQRGVEVGPAHLGRGMGGGHAGCWKHKK